jgi:shikimate dehydrogenase
VSAIKAGVAGNPIGHSLSPLIHGAWLAASGLVGVYSAYEPADVDEFRALVAEGRAGGLRGLNVTSPFKADALSLADEASETARRAGSANLLVFDQGRIRANSTDGLGLLIALREQAPELSLAAGPALVLGAGGAAAAAVAALIDAGAPEVIIWNRTLARAQDLARALDPSGMRVRAGGDAESAILVVRAVSGEHAHDFASTPKVQAAMDMSYRPLRTDFLRAAGAVGAAEVDGLAMLIGQARPSFAAIFGVEPPPGVDVRRMALERLGAG